MQAADSDQIYQFNMAVLTDRWPVFAAKIDQADLSPYQFEITLGDTSTVSVNGIQLTSRHAPLDEAEIQANATPIAEKLYLYGFGLGFLADHLLKTRDELRSLEIKITNVAIFKFILNILDISEITKHPKVGISLACDDVQMPLPCFVHPECLTLCDDDNLKIRDQIHYYVRHKFINDAHYKDEKLIERIKKFNYHKNGKAKGVSNLFKAYRLGRACIIGAGPSLEDNIEKLKQLGREHNNIIIACDTATVALNHYGINPDYVVTLDKKIKIDHFHGFNNKKTNLVFFPTTSIEFISEWDGPKFYAITTSPLFDELKKTEAANTLIANGSVIHPAIDLGIAMGYKEILLFGADFAFIKNKTHAHWKSGELWGDPNSKYLLLNGKAEKVPSTPSLSAYLFSTESIIRNNKDVKFYNTSLEGAPIAGAIQFLEL